MPGQRARRRPTFQAQAMLIVLPLVILVAVGAWSLRQDRLLAEQEARDDARQFAERLLPELAEAIADPLSVALASAHAQPLASNTAFGSLLFQVSQSGRLLKPAPVDDPLPRPLDPAELDPELAEIWKTARGAEFRDLAADTARMSYRLFLDQSPPDEFAAAARMSVALLEAQQGRKPESLEQLRAVLAGSPAILLESGLPAQPIAALKLMEFAGHSVGNEIPWVELLGPVCSNAVEYPSWVTSPLLEAVARLADKLDRPELKDWSSLWTRHERARRVYQDARHHGWRSGPFWILSSDGAWLALADPAVPDPWIVCTSESVLGQEFDTVWCRTGNLPAYFGAGVTVASRQYRLAHDRLTGQWQPNEIARRGASDFPRAQASGSTTDRALDADADEAIRLAGTSTPHPVLGVLGLEIFLDNPSLLFARQRIRTYWFAALIALSAFAALVGLVSAWRAFHRQELLARMQSQFVSSVSHELRAPIASIRLLAEGLELGRVRAPDKQAEYFSLMGQECRRLTALIENVLDFSRIDQGRKEFEFESTDVRALVLQTIRLMEPQAAERQVTLTIDFRDADHGPPIIDRGTTGVCLQPSLDGRAIQQALVNLIDNASKHAPSNSTVEVGLAFERPVQPVANDTVSGSPDAAVPFRIWVRDSGEGIPATEHEKIFEPFYRRGTELRRETTGIGIGLTIVRHIVEAHGGRVTVESEPGHGSKFTLHIP